MTKSYEDQIQEQIEQYRHTEKIHDLPPVFHLWTSEYLMPGLKAVFEVSGVNAFYVNAFVTASRRCSAQPVFLSLGCGDGTVEIGIARTLVDVGISRFRFVCYDLSDILLDRFRAAIPPDLTDRFDLRSGDLNLQALDSRFDAVMANHSLHHMVDLEGIFSAVYNSLHEHGIFVTNDMIGRNGHMRWPEARLFVDFLWPFLTPAQRINRSLGRLEKDFADHDCSSEGFEGIRSQDVLPSILRQGFHPWKFLGLGGMIDVFVDRPFGPNIDVDDPDDKFLACRIGLLNDILLDAGLVKPTAMFAYFTKQPCDEIYYRNRSARASVRDTATDPAWLADATADLDRLKGDPDFAFRSLENERGENPQPRSVNGKLAEMLTVLRLIQNETVALRAQQAIAAETLAALHQARAEFAATRDRLASVSDSLAALNHAQSESLALQSSLSQQANFIRAMETSTSWQLTAPLRMLVRMVRRSAR